MDRRRFLAKLSALSAVGLAGCPGGGGGTDTPGGTDTDGADASVPTASPTDPPMSTATRSPADAATDTPAPTATPTAEPTPTATPEPTPTATPTTPEPGAETNLPRLQTDGKWIVDEDGNEVVLRGVATAEPGYVQNTSANATWMEALSMLVEESTWYPGVVRIPVTIDGWQTAGSPSTYAATYLDEAVDLCAENDVYVLIDHHLVKEYESDETDRVMREFWSSIAPRYADRDHVIYELYNEPTEPAFWDDDQQAWTTWKEIAQPWVDIVQDNAPDTPLVIGSPRWTSMPHMAPDDPFEGDNLIYSGHIYPANGTPEEFDSTYGAPAEEVPVMITEFGWSELGEASVDQGTTSGWGEGFREWVDSYPNMGWQGWCFDPDWLPRLVDSEWNTKGGDSFAGHFIKRWLYEKRNERTPDALATDGPAYTGPEDQTAPAAPTGLSTFDVSDDQFEVAWDPVEDGETTTQFYRVYVDGTERSATRSEILTLSGTPGESYDVSVTAVDAVGNESARSETVTHRMEGELRVDAEISTADAAPEIDGDVDDAWTSVESRSLENVLIGDVESEEDLGATWRAQWDDDAFYVLVDVTDDDRSNDSDAQYNDDSVEVFVDADNSKGDEYDGTNDFQFSFPWDGEEIRGQFPSGANPNQTVTWDQTDTDAGYRMEISLPWSLLGVDPVDGHAMGFDVHVNDDDGGGGRDAKIAWYGEEDVAWQNPSVLATVQLVE